LADRWRRTLERPAVDRLGQREADEVETVASDRRSDVGTSIVAGAIERCVQDSARHRKRRM